HIRDPFFHFTSLPSNWDRFLRREPCLQTARRRIDPFLFLDRRRRVPQKSTPNPAGHRSRNNSRTPLASCAIAALDPRTLIKQGRVFRTGPHDRPPCPTRHLDDDKPSDNDKPALGRAQALQRCVIPHLWSTSASLDLENAARTCHDNEHLVGTR